MDEASRRAFLALSPEDREALVALHFKTTPLAECGVSLTAIADVVYAWRLTHNGYVPITVFEPLLGPVTVSVQLIHPVLDSTTGEILGYAMRLRDATEAGAAYEGKYHNTCGSLRWRDDLGTATARNAADAGDQVMSPAELIGVTLHHEAPRRNMDLTFMHSRSVFEEDIVKMGPGWKLFSLDEIRGMKEMSAKEMPIVASNLAQLLWAMDENRPWFGVLKDTYPDSFR